MEFQKNELEIKEIAKKVLTLSRFGFDDESSINARKISEESSYYGYYNKNTWSVFFLWGEEDFGRSRTASLHIDDETGLPVQLQHTMGQSKIRYQFNESTNEITTDTGVTFSWV